MIDQALLGSFFECDYIYIHASGRKHPMTGLMNVWLTLVHNKSR